MKQGPRYVALAILVLAACPVTAGAIFLNAPLTAGRLDPARRYEISATDWTNPQRWGLRTVQITAPAAPVGGRPGVRKLIARLIQIGPVMISH